MKGTLITMAGITALLACGYTAGHSNATSAAETAMREQREAAEALTREHKAQIQELEARLLAAATEAEETFNKELERVEANAQTVVADLNADVLRLHERWTGCNSLRERDAAAHSRELDAITRDRNESTGRIVRAAAHCDAQVAGLQLYILEVEELLKQARGSSRR